MLTMTRLPSDSFLPTGGILDANERAMTMRNAHHQHPPAPLLDARSASVVSPLSLPHSTNSTASYFDEPSISAALSPPDHQRSAIAPAPKDLLSQPYHSLSPRLSSLASDEKRPSSRSPTRHQTLSRAASNSAASSSSACMSMSSTTSPDGSASQLQRVIAQNRRLLENWEAERAHLEANRARAEEIYREERAIMDDERMVWAGTESRLLEEVREYRRRAEIAEAERDQMAAERDALKEELKSLRSRSTSMSPPGVDGASDGPLVVRLRKASDVVSPPKNSTVLGRRGLTMPKSHPFNPLDPRMQSASPDSGTPNEKPDPVPLIDVAEVDPTLDGISLKRSAIERSTFESASGTSTRNSPTGSGDGSPNNRSRAASKTSTNEVLKAPENVRLRMNAGHTPNHSMSLSALPTVQSTRAPNTASSSGTATPTTEQTAPVVAAMEEEEEKSSQSQVGAKMANEVDFNAQGFADEVTIMEPTVGADDDDRPLTGPLHLMNRPAVDEPFLDLLNKRLLSGDGTPAVLKSLRCSPDPEPTELDLSEAAPEEGAGGAMDDEGIKPLLFKNTSNFGARLGELKAPAGF